jgi:hypothetical protein
MLTVAISQFANLVSLAGDAARARDDAYRTK